MFLKFFNKLLSNMKEVYDMALFGIMSDEDIYFIFNGSPMFYVMLPILGFLITLQAGLRGYELFKAQNKNFDRWFSFIVSSLCATLASISMYGSVIAAYYELHFALGPWFFLASASVATVHQLTMIGINLYRVFESPLNSVQHKHYLQAALNNLFNLAMLTTVIGAVTFVMLSSAAPAFGASCAFAVVGFTATNILWRIIPDNWKRGLKNVLGIGKPSEEEQQQPQSNIKCALTSSDKPQQAETHYQGIFTKCDHSAVVKSKSFDDGLEYLQSVIVRKISVFNNNPLPHSDKNKQKKALLKDLLQAFEGDFSCSKELLSQRYPLAFQSFWAEKGDVEQIVEAALVLKDRFENTNAIGSLERQIVANL